jgi:hypothetical protein
VLDARVYRAAFLPALIAVFVVAFSLADRPAPATTPLAADAFSTSRAFGAEDRPVRDSLLELGRSFPSRRPGSAGDEGLAGRVERALGRAGFEVRREVDEARTIDGERDLVTVSGVRPGLSSRRIVVLAHRDALGTPGLAELSGTAALLELARVFRARDLRKTLVLVSTSGATGGAGGARAWAERAAGGPVDGMLVLGDLAGARVRKPWVVPWSNGEREAPLGLRRTVEAAVRREVGEQPGGFRAPSQWVRRALPATVSEQGEPAAAGLPAVLLSVSGERGPAPAERVVLARLDEFGRAAVRAVSAIDAATGSGGREAAFAGEPAGIVTLRNVMPGWTVRVLVLCLLLPALLAALDAYFRARRRRLPGERWAAWIVASSVPFAVAWLWARGLGLLQAVDAPGAPVLPAWRPLDAPGAIALASSVVAGLLAWFALRPLLVRRIAVTGSPAAGGAGAALGLVLAGLALMVWLDNAYAAALLLPAAHVWLFLAAPGTRLRGWRASVAVAAGLLPALLAVLYWCLALGLGPLGLGWSTFLAVAGGHLTLVTGLVVALLGGCVVTLVAILASRRAVAAHARPEPLLTRGPAGYAGPGSLGGTESALRR